jgi:hypothetical protein
MKRIFRNEYKIFFTVFAKIYKDNILIFIHSDSFTKAVFSFYNFHKWNEHEGWGGKQLKKNNQEIRDLVYVHLNETGQNVISYGVKFSEFAQSLPRQLNHLLLLKHRFDDAELNSHTMLQFVTKDKIGKLARDNIHSYGDFCWIDFEEEDGVDELSGQEIAELLYLGHLKQHLKMPFYNKLGNRYVYLSQDDGWFNKTYYRQLNDFYRMLGQILAMKLADLKIEKTIIGLRKKRSYPPVNMDILLSLSKFMREGTVFSLRNAYQTRNRIEIPIWVIGDFDNMDEMFDEFAQMKKERYDAKLVFEKKAKEWSLVAN